MFNPSLYENSRPDGFAVLEVHDPREAGEPIKQGQAAPRRFVPLKQTRLEGEVVGPLATLQLTQLFGFTRAACDRVIEAAYRFPLPGDAAVTGVRVRFGETEITAELKERERAETEYQDARREGRQATLLTREAPDVFTLLVAGIAPDQDVTVETRYVQLARPEGPGWTLRVPLTTAPRYARSDEVTGRHAHGQPLLVQRDPGHRFSLEVHVAGAASVASPTHALEILGTASASDTGRGVVVRLRDGEVLPDRDCVLTWRPPQAETVPTLSVWTCEDTHSQEAALSASVEGTARDPVGGHTYFLAAVAPPRLDGPAAAGGAPSGPPREVILLVDHSGSMEGAKWEAADWAVKQFLAGLRPDDRFNLGLFHNRTRWFAQSPQPATPATVRHAMHFLETHRDSGGTELGVALEQALSQDRRGPGVPSTSEQPGGALARHVLLVTDAQVSDEGRILRLADEERSARTREHRRRISMLCIDAAPNSFLAQELAERGGGLARFLTSAPDEEDITTALDEVLADWGQPVAAHLRLVVTPGPVEASGGTVQASVRGGMPDTIELCDLPSGRTVWVAGRVPGSLATGAKHEAQASLRLRLLAGSNELGTWSARAPQGNGESLPPAGGPALRALETLFGARRVLGLEFLTHSGYTGADLADQLQRLGYDPASLVDSVAVDSTPRVYAENARQDAQPALRGLLAQEALRYGLASSETAFVATRTERGRPVEGTVLVANALASGWSDDFITGAPAPMMATPAPAAAPSFLRSLTRKLAPPASTTFAARTLMETARPAAPASATLFSGTPDTRGGEVVLYDSLLAGGDLPAGATLTRLRVTLGDSGASSDDVDQELTLLLFVEDLAAPRARVRLRDVLRQGGERPLNLVRRAGAVVRLVLLDPAGVWRAATPSLEVAVLYR